MAQPLLPSFFHCSYPSCRNKNTWTQEGGTRPVRLERALVKGMRLSYPCGHTYHMACIAAEYSRKVSSTSFSYLDLFFTRSLSVTISCTQNRFVPCLGEKAIDQVFENPRFFTLYDHWKRSKLPAQISFEKLVQTLGFPPSSSIEECCNLVSTVPVFQRRGVTILDRFSLVCATASSLFYVTICLTFYCLVCVLDLWPDSREEIKKRAYQSIGHLYLRMYIKMYPALREGL